MTKKKEVPETNCNDTRTLRQRLSGELGVIEVDSSKRQAERAMDNKERSAWSDAMSEAVACAAHIALTNIVDKYNNPIHLPNIWQSNFVNSRLDYIMASRVTIAVLIIIDVFTCV